MEIALRTPIVVTGAGRFMHGGRLMVDIDTARKCPNCGSEDINARTSGTAFYRAAAPRQDVLPGTRGKKVIDRVFRCGECAHEFSEVEELEF